MSKIVFVTNDENEFNVIKEKFNKYGVDIEQFNYGCDESINVMPKYKAMKVYNLIGKESFVISSRYYVNNYIGEQGFLIKKENKSFLITRLTYYDGVFFRDFYKIDDKIITSKEMTSDNIILELWIDSIPLNSLQFSINITEEEQKNLRDGIDQITSEFIKWKHNNEVDLNTKIESFNNVKKLFKN